MQLAIYIISLSVLVSAVLHLRAEKYNDVRKIYIFKSLTTSLIIGLAFYMGSLDSLYTKLIILGLIFSLAGDVFLISENGFVRGLLSFLVAHVFYIAAFVIELGIDQVLYLPSLLPFVLFALVVIALVYPGLGTLKIPVFVYISVILLMGWQSLNLYLVEASRFALSACVGAAFFMLSDSLIAIDKFRSELKHNRLLIMSTYYLGQWLIALSILGFGQ